MDDTSMTAVKDYPTDLGSRRIKALRIDVQFMIDHPEMVKIRDDLQKILRQKPGD
jgi:hypothetical protein